MSIAPTAINTAIELFKDYGMTVERAIETYLIYTRCNTKTSEDFIQLMTDYKTWGVMPITDGMGNIRLQYGCH
jgi:hypothetical protein